MGRQCFDTSALDGGLSETELMAAKWRGRSTIWQHCLRATVFGRLFCALLKNFCFIIGRTIRYFRGHIQRNGINVCDVLTETRVDRKSINRGLPVFFFYS
jgi:hypothetical protein